MSRGCACGRRPHAEWCNASFNRYHSVVTDEMTPAGRDLLHQARLRGVERATEAVGLFAAARERTGEPGPVTPIDRLDSSQSPIDRPGGHLSDEQIVTQATDRARQSIEQIHRHAPAHRQRERLAELAGRAEREAEAYRQLMLRAYVRASLLRTAEAASTTNRDDQ